MTRTAKFNGICWRKPCWIEDKGLSEIARSHCHYMALSGTVTILASYPRHHLLDAKLAVNDGSCEMARKAAAHFGRLHPPAQRILNRARSRGWMPHCEVQPVEGGIEADPRFVVRSISPENKCLATHPVTKGKE
ncbi:MAG TPA: hypothetical protein VFZ27_15080 [Terriglobia bacterium]|nr:hypothetical protein [Terriglobia bacterium]